MQSENGNTTKAVELTVSIVSAFVSHNFLDKADIAKLISSTHSALVAAYGRCPVEVPDVPKRTASPAEIRKSVSQDALISFEDGKPYKTLKRHITALGMTPEQYRAKWGLPADYPMVSPAYSRQRSDLAKKIGLGIAGGQAARREPETAAAE